MKVVVLGLDGCSWRLLTPFMNKGFMPNMKLIVETGASANLISTVPPVTSPAWPSMTTGLNPGKLGVFNTVTFIRSNEDKLMVKPVTSDIYQGKAVWDYLSDEGFQVALFKVPFLYPVYEINGCMVSGFGSASKFSAYPRNLHAKLIAGPSRLLEESLFKKLSTLRLDDKRRCLEFIQQLSGLVQDESETVYELLSTLPWDFVFYVISPTDWLQHAFMDKLVELAQKLEYGDVKGLNMLDKALVNFYQRIDFFVGKILKSLEKIEDEYVLLVVSDHGFTIRPYTFNLARWLVEKGYMKLKAPCQDRTYNMSALSQTCLDVAERFASRTEVERVLRLLPTQVLSSLGKVYYRASVSSFGSISKHIDFSASEAYCLEDRAVYINSSADYEEVLSRLIKDLTRSIQLLRGPKLRALRKHEVYWGDKVEHGPDLIVEVIEGDSIWELSTDPNKPGVFRPPLPGRHNYTGIFVAYGTQIRKGLRLGNKFIWDVASTILHAFDVALPSHIDGEALKEIYQGRSRLAQRSTRYQIDEEERIRRIIHSIRSKTINTLKP